MLLNVCFNGISLSGCNKTLSFVSVCCYFNSSFNSVSRIVAFMFYLKLFVFTIFALLRIIQHDVSFLVVLFTQYL